MQDLELNQIRLDGGTQVRVGINRDVIQEYAEAMSEGAKFPPLVVFHDGESYWLADGFHRHAAAQVLELESFQCDVREGSIRDATLFAVGANASHGLRRTSQDKRNAVSTLLKDPKWAKWSDREIARQCAVDHKTVASLRRVYPGNSPDDSRTVQRNGSVYQQRLRANKSEQEDVQKPDLAIAPKTVDDKPRLVVVSNEEPEEKPESQYPPEVQKRIDETGGQRVVMDADGKVLFHPWSKEKQKSYKVMSDFSMDITDNLEWILDLELSEVYSKVLPEYREEVGQLLCKAEAHMRQLLSIWRMRNDTEQCVEQSNR